jgi:hypothetical protein
VIQITSDFAKVPFNQLKIIDFRCDEGVYAIEAALRGAEVLALDARDERMKDGVRVSTRLGLASSMQASEVISRTAFLDRTIAPRLDRPVDLLVQV